MVTLIGFLLSFSFRIEKIKLLPVTIRFRKNTQFLNSFSSIQKRRSFSKLNKRIRGISIFFENEKFHGRVWIRVWR